MSALSPQAYGFINRIRSLHNLDKDAVPFLAAGEWVQFRDDPVKFLIRANDETAAAICAAVEARQPSVECKGGVKGHRELIQALSRMTDRLDADGSTSLVGPKDRSIIIDGCYDLMLSDRTGGLKERAEDPDNCPICALPLKAGDTCATDIELGTCHAECLEGSPTVNLDTGEPVDGPIPTYPYEPESEDPGNTRGWLYDMLDRFPLGSHFTIEHDGFAGTVCGYYCRADGKLGVNLQLDGAKVVHVYGEKWLGGGND
jgi:hypothetical protein